ncbi:MAG: hypothetical protein K6G61_04985 [Solobacterium sp.]|nr:hypothetical protein [Solobacterium sp.]
MNEDRKRKITDLVLAYILPLAAVAFFALRYGMYYNTNDDMTFKAISAGLYDGIPDGHLIFIQYVLGYPLSRLCAAFRGIDFYGCMIVLINYLCITSVLHRVLTLCRDTKQRLMTYIAAGSVLIMVFMLDFFIFQWTVTASICAATAVFLYYTDDSGSLPNSIAVTVLFWLSFCIRRMCFLMLCPLFLIILLTKEKTVENIRRKKPLMKKHTVCICASLAVLLAVTFGIEIMQYGSGEWVNYKEYNDYRAEITDYYGFPPYETNSDLYDSLGIPAETVPVLDNYGLNIASEITKEDLAQLAERGEELFTQTSEEETHLHKTLRILKTAMTDKGMVPSLILTIAAVLAALAAFRKEKRLLFSTLTMIAVCVVLSLYLCWQGRYPYRVAKGFMLVLFAMMCAFLLSEKHELSMPEGFKKPALAVLLAMTAMTGWVTFKEIIAYRNQDWHADMWNRYVAEHQENNYVFEINVESSYRFVPVMDYDLQNAYVVGGWLTKSPFRERQLAHSGASSYKELLVDYDNTYLLTNSPTTYLEDYLRAVGYPCTTEITEVLFDPNIPYATVNVVKFIRTDE